MDNPDFHATRRDELCDTDSAGRKWTPRRLTLTNLYNEMPAWLKNAHRKLDEAVAAAYAHTTADPAWSAGMSDEQILEKLLALNLERA